MKRHWRWLGGLIFIVLLLRPQMSPAGDAEQTLTVAPFVEYNYLSDMGGAEDLLDRVNAGLGGWLRGYENIDLFEHLFLVGAEFRLARPQQWHGLEFFASLAASAGSTGMIEEDYDKRYDLKTISLVPGLVDTGNIPFTNIEGRVHLRVDQYLDYYIPLQLGVRYETRPADGSLSFFGMISGGVLFLKGGLDIDADMTGSLESIAVSGETRASYRGEAEMEDTGWTLSTFAGMRYYWRPDLSSTFAVGYGLGKVKDDVDIQGHFAGNISVNSLLTQSSLPFSTTLKQKESIDCRIDGWRARLVVLEWKW